MGNALLEGRKKEMSRKKSPCFVNSCSPCAMELFLLEKPFLKEKLHILHKESPPNSPICRALFTEFRF